MTGPEQPANVTMVTSTNRAGTISVRATDQGLPVDVRIDKRELRFGAQALADEVLRLCQRAAVEARARRRDELAAAGVPPDVLDRLGLPTRDVADARYDADEEQDTAPTSWMRPI
ncbi:hypothetical protein [Antrihabitans cavernicola]|uniref:YbaB/EbfC family DNA-binding protein n=1 Tax=Antrihabitans cavernicola TaxID=2495913 RepID=A0A5A7SDH9_9NOCA|nr:hypothetical protein [Spelaeibacter cavernicola]KAA0022797.1 hypothetical protein FOY51_13405 [Spelaeibacter cavernicola]